MHEGILNDGVTVIDRYGPMPLGSLKLEIIFVQFHVSNTVASMLVNNETPENLNWTVLDSRLSNPKYATLVGNNEVALNFGRIHIENKKINIAPLAAVNGTVLILGF